MHLFTAAAVAAVLGRPAHMIPKLDEPPGTIVLKLPRNWDLTLRPVPPAIPGGVRLSLNLHVTKQVSIGFDKMVKADGVSARFSFIPGVELGAGVYRVTTAVFLPRVCPRPRLLRWSSRMRTIWPATSPKCSPARPAALPSPITARCWPRPRSTPC